MLILQCPYCGVQADETELTAGGEAHLTRHGPGADDESFENYLFMRENPKGLHFERWRHSYGPTFVTSSPLCPGNAIRMISPLALET